MIVSIYTLTDPRTGAVRYIGKSTQPKVRLANHLCPHRLRSKRHVARWLTGLNAAGLKPVMTVIETVASDQWQAREVYWIALYRTEGADLCNITPGGEGGSVGPTGRRPAPHVIEMFRQLGLAQRGKRLGCRLTPEGRERIRQGAIARWKRNDGSIGHSGGHSAATRAKISAANRGRKPSRLAIERSVATRKSLAAARAAS